MVDMIACARRRRGTVHSCPTRREHDIAKLENEDWLTPWDQRKGKCLKKQAKGHDLDFEQCHVRVEVLNFIEGEYKSALNSEEAVFEEHMNRVSYIIVRLEQLESLVATTKPVMSHASWQGHFQTWG